MRTTLKRGLGRGTPPSGNGRPVLPPGVPSPVALYRQPPPPARTPLGWAARVALWLAAGALILAVGSAAGAYLYFHESVAAVAARTPEVRQAARRLDVALPGQPATALVIGYDRRKSDGKGAPSRSDTLMLVRADPGTDSISLLSFPRDLRVAVHCPGRAPYFDKIAHAYQACGPQGSLSTVKALTGLPINYLITVNFRGFRQIVDRLGGVWLDVDRRYFNDRGGPYGYATINLFPGYQKLTGRQALDYVRYRHADSDLYRVARQQQFVRAFRSQVRESFAPTALPKVVNAITSNVEVAQGGGGDVDGETVLSYALFAYGLPRGRIFQARIEGLEGFAELTTASENIQRAVDEFTHPDVESPEKATAVALGERLKQAAPPPRETTVTVLNGNGVTGSASTAGFLLRQRGYQILTPPNGLPANAPRFDYFRTQVYFAPRLRGAERAARKVANLFASAEVARLPAEIAPLSNGAMVTVVVGQTFHGRLAPAPVDQTPRRERPDVVRAPAAARDLLRERQPRVPFPLMVPTVIERSSWTDRTTPVRMYWIDPEERHKAVRLVFRTGSNEYWGVQMSDWEDAPVLADRNLTRRIGGRTYDLYYNGAKLHMVVLRTPQARYWVVNTLLDRLSNETMLAIAKGLRPLERTRPPARPGARKTRR
ncbi:MAG TPA: LCP family protein [Gaiellaceae bacterium]|nr:LCP family protein [Gaiellaceae bacterium]